jgi:hypothetical protein
MMIFSSILGLQSAQADITAAFIHATLPPEDLRQGQFIENDGYGFYFGV